MRVPGGHMALLALGGFIVDPRSISRASKQQKPPTQGGFGSPANGGPQGGLSPLVSQYQQWNRGGATGSLPRPASVFTDATFGPMSPIPAYEINTPHEDDGLTDPRRFEYQVSFNMPVGIPGSEGGSGKLAPFSSMRQICELYSLAAACIDLRISEIRGLGWEIVPTKEAAAAMKNSPSMHSDFSKRKAEADRFFKKPDSDYFDFSTWLCALLYDLFTVDAMSLYIWPTRTKGKGLLGSSLAELAVIDGTTIKPLVDVYGSRPKPPNVAYQQYMYGVPRTDLMTIADPDRMDEDPDNKISAVYKANQLLYLPYYTRSNSVYGLAPIERALIPAMTGLNRQKYQLDFYTEGTIPGMFISPGTEMSMAQMRTFQDALNALASDPAWKHKIIVVPQGSEVFPQKPAALADQADEVIMNQMCMAFGVMPMELGISPRVSAAPMRGAGDAMARASGETNKRKALKPLLLFLKDTIFDNILQNICGQADMEWMWEGLEEGTDEEAQIALLAQEIATGLKCIDEGRVERGLNPWGIPGSSEPGILTTQGLVSLATGQLFGAPSMEDRLSMEQQYAPKPAEKPAAGDKPASSSSPSSAGARAGNDEADRQVGAKPGAGGGQSGKAALAELDQLRRRLKQGKDVTDWECKSIDKGILTSLLYGLRMGEDPLGLIEKARRAVNDAGQYDRREEGLSAVKADIASGLGKLANGLRTGRIAAPEFVDQGTEVMRNGLGAAFRLGCAHALTDRGHPGHLMHKGIRHPLQAVTSPTESSYEVLADDLNEYWDQQADLSAEASRNYLQKLMRDVLIVGGAAAVATQMASRLGLYGQQAQASYEKAYGLTLVAVSEAQALSDGDGPVTLDDGTEVEPGDQIIIWNGSGGDECELCADREGEEYTMDTLPCWPGDGFFGDFCEGGPNCNCYLTYEDATSRNTIRTDGYANERRIYADAQATRRSDLNELRRVFVDSLPDAAGARAAARDAARQQLADEMGAYQGYTAWPQDVSAADVRDRVNSQG